MINLGFILSTGRTGTQFFEEYLTKSYKNTLCLHEPRPSRKYKFYSNKYLQGKIDKNDIYQHFKNNRNKVLNQTDLEHYIESNNFMFGCIEALNHYYSNIKTLHIIRHPETYVRSHLNHGFWKAHKKVFAKYVKYWIENLDINKTMKKDPIYLLISRWKYVNDQIAKYRNTNKYKVVRFEDTFSRNSNASVQKLTEIKDFFELEQIGDNDILKWLNQPKNISRKVQTDFIIKDEHKEFMRTYLKDLLNQHEYTIS